MLNRELFVKNLIALGVVFDKEVTEPVIDIYYNVLGDMTDEQFTHAVNHIMNTHKFNTLPKPADFLNAVNGNGDSACIMAWDKVVNAMARVGAYHTVMFDDVLIHGFIQGHEGGWAGLCKTEHEQLVWVRKDFERYYKAMQGMTITVEPLKGIVEGHDVSIGHDGKRDIVYIGDEVKCLAMLEDAPKLLGA